MKFILDFFSNLFKKKDVIPTSLVAEVPKEKDSSLDVSPKPPEPTPKHVVSEAVLPASPKKDLWYPLAKKWTKTMTTRGNYRKGYPEGAIVHFTAGRYGTQDMDSGIASGYAYMLIDDKGNVYQANPLNRWGYHAGESSWEGLGSGVSEYLVGIEMTAAGKLTKVGDKFQSWFKSNIPENEVRYVKNKDNQKEGYYQKYTPAQEDSLVKLLLWLKENNPSTFSFDFVLGHDEVAPKRKNDPGGALSSTMPDLREKLKKAYSEKKPSPVIAKTQLDLMVEAYKKFPAEFSQLKEVTLAQWIYESKHGSSDLFKTYKNAGQLKWRGSLGVFDAAMVKHNNEEFASFKTWESFFSYYWKFLERPVYAGWRNSFKVSSIGFLEHIVKCGYSSDPRYVKNVQELIPEAKKLLS